MSAPVQKQPQRHLTVPMARVRRHVCLRPRGGFAGTEGWNERHTPRLALCAAPLASAVVPADHVRLRRSTTRRGRGVRESGGGNAMEDTYLIAWAAWWAVLLISAVLSLQVALRLATDQPLGKNVLWQILSLTFLLVWFFVNDDWNKLHLLWLTPLTAVATFVALLILSIR